MLSQLLHRGPDDLGDVSIPNFAWLGHTRLSIVDLGGGRQPLEADGVSLVCNGEIYNHEELRDKLGQDRFRTNSDSEVALRLLVDKGPEALSELRGMWALCAAGPGMFVAARDPLGIKPLYWARHDGVVHFASELRAFDPEVRWAVEAFPPGCWWTPEDGLVRFASHAPTLGRLTEQPIEGSPAPFRLDVPVPSRPPAHKKPPMSWQQPHRTAVKLSTGGREGWSAGDTLAEVRDVIVDSVERHLMADVPVGVFLSGGLDSSIVAAAAAKSLADDGRKLQTFAVGTPESSDLQAAREVADFLGTEHHEAMFDGRDALDAVEDVVAAVESFDPLLIRSAVPNWFLAELASKHVKVVLTGEGADELFAGYSYYHSDFTDPAALQAELVRGLGELHGLNLQRCDRVTMAHSLEARVPFLDYDVIACALSLPVEWKTVGSDRVEKRLLREAFRGWLPDKIIDRKKEQFGTGSGAADVLAEQVSDGIELAEFERERDVVEPPLRNREELAYFRMYTRHLAGLRPERTLTRFAHA
jgi:asparagine synthase (glutamine-hydrolysing)